MFVCVLCVCAQYVCVCLCFSQSMKTKSLSGDFCPVGPLCLSIVFVCACVCVSLIECENPGCVYRLLRFSHLVHWHAVW